MSEAPTSFARPLRWAGKVVHCPKCGARGALDLGCAFQRVLTFEALHVYACSHCMQPGFTTMLPKVYR